MGEREARTKALRALKSALESREQAQVFYRALTGDGVNTDTNVTGRANFTWVRYNADSSKVSQVLNVRLPDVDPDVTVIIGREYHSDQLQILGYDTSLYVDTLGSTPGIGSGIGRHGATHNANGGSDPAPIDLRNIVEGRVQPTDPASTSVDVNAFRYCYAGVQIFEGDDIDLSAWEPAAGLHAMLLVYLDMTTGLLGVESGEAVALAIGAPYPDVPALTIPLALVDYVNGATSVTGTSIYDYRVAFHGCYLMDHLHSGPGDGGASLVDLQEIFLADASYLMISSAAISPTQVYHTLGLQAMYIGSADLSWIWPDASYGEGQLLLIRPDPSLSMYGETFSLRIVHGTGNIHLSGEQDVYLDNPHDHLLLVYDGQYWCDVAVPSVERKKTIHFVTANYSAGPMDDILIVDATGGDIVVSLLSAIGNAGRVLTVKRIDGSANTVTVQGTETIDDALNQTLAQYDALVVASDGGEWWIL